MVRSKSLQLLFLLVLITGGLVGTPSSSTPPAGAAAPPWVDTQNREAVVAAFQNEFGRTAPTHGWTGARQGCVAGTTSQAFRDSIFSRVNYFRSMAGVPAGVTENAGYSAKAQQAALMMSVSGRLSHSPDGSFGCYTADGAAAAAASDLYLGRTGTESINGYMEDPGAGNVRAGHRNWVLHPTTGQMGTGDIPASGGWASNTLWVFDNVFGPQPALRESDGFVAWPPRGYVPGHVVYPRWSLSLRGGDFSAATVSMTSNGSNLPVTVVHRDGANNGAPFPIVVWEPSGVNTSPQNDTTYRVTVNGARLNGQPRSFAYEVTILGSAPPVDPATFHPFVDQAYLDFFGRNALTSERDYWSGRLAAGTSRYDFVRALANSDAWTANVVNRLYLDTLGRQADSAGRAYWIGRLQGGLPVAQVAASFYGSPEYVTLQGGTYAAWVRDLYGVLLLRSADGGGLDFWSREAVGQGPGSVAYRFYQSAESRQARVTALYLTFLGRNPDPGGLAAWTEVLASGDDLRLAAFLASSDEYFIRASS